MLYLCKDIKLSIFPTMTSKNHTISRVVAKTCVRLVFILLAFSLYIFFTKEENELQHLHFQNHWAIIAPCLLFIGLVTLMTVMLKNKYTKTDLNWLFSLSAIFFSIYLLLLYSRIYPLL
jgi:cytochrome bd-type quinol oxidase subunit 2